MQIKRDAGKPDNEILKLGVSTKIASKHRTSSNFYNIKDEPFNVSASKMFRKRI